MPRLPKKPPELWDAQKEHIRSYYIIDNMTLKKTMELMRAKHNFDATRKEYVSRLACWNMSKNLKKDDWELVHARTSAQKQSRVLLNDREINPRRLKRAPGRYGFTIEDSFQSVVTSCSSTRGLTIRSPSPDPVFHASIATLPWVLFQSTLGPHLSWMVHKLIPSLTWVNPYGSPFFRYSDGDLSLRSARSLLAKILGRSEKHNDTDPTLFILQRLADVLPRESNPDTHLQSNEPFILLIQCLIYSSSNNLLTLGDMGRFLTWILDSGSAALFYQFICRLERIPSPTFQIFLNHLLLSAISLENSVLVSSLLRHHTDVNYNSIDHRADHGSDWYVFMGLTWTPLQLATFRGNDQISRLLVRYGAMPDAVSVGMPSSPLELAISVKYGHFPIAEMLIASGASIDQFCELEVVKVDDAAESLLLRRTERTLLMKAVEVQNVEIIRLLLSTGAPVNDVSSISGGALQIAIKKNDLDVLEILLEAGAKVNMLDEMEMSAKRFFEGLMKRFGFAEDNEDNKNRQEYLLIPTTSELEGQIDRATFFLPLEIAARQDKINVVRRLLDAGALANDCLDWDKIWKKVSTPPRQSIAWEFYQLMMETSRVWFQSPLHHSVNNGNVEMTTLLLKHGAAVNSRNAFGTTPLQLACGLGREDLDETRDGLGIRSNQVRIDLAQLLISWGAEVNSSPGPLKGRTALQAALEKGDEQLVELLLSLGADINGPSSLQGGLTAPQAAVRAGSFNLIRLLTLQGAAFTIDMYWIATYMAVSNGDLPAVEQFLNQGVDVNALYTTDSMFDIQGSILQASIRSSNLDVAQVLLDAGADVNLLAGGETALCMAARENDRNALAMLLSHGANPNVPNSKITPLAIAAARGDKGMVQCLMHVGADVNHLSHNPISDNIDSCSAATPLWWKLDRLVRYHTPKSGNVDPSVAATPLWWTLDNLREHARRALNCTETIRDLQDIAILLLSHAANPNIPGLRGEFSIQIAAESGHKVLVQLLLDTGADVNAPARESDSQTALECAIRAYNFYEGEEVVRILIKAGAHIRDKGVLLKHATYRGYFWLVPDLIKAGADVNSPAIVNSSAYFESRSPLYSAVEKGREDIVQLLIGHGADVNAPLSPCGRRLTDVPTALEIAASRGRINIAKLLIQNGADINAPSRSTDPSRGEGTALQRAAYYGRLDMVYLLLENDTAVDLIQSRCNEAALWADARGHNILARLLRDYTPQKARQID